MSSTLVSMPATVGLELGLALGDAEGTEELGALVEDDVDAVGCRRCGWYG